MTDRSIYRVSETYPAPTLVDGHPVDWQPSTTTTEEWGTFRIELGAVWDLTVDPPVVDTPGTDITTINGARTRIDSLSFAEPYGETTGQLSINVSELASHTSSLAWLDGVGGQRVDIYHVLPDDSEVGYWHGFVASVELASAAGITTAISLQLSGALSGEAALRAHQPFMYDQATDLGTCIARALDPATHARPLNPFTQFQFESTTTGIDVRMRGSRGQMVLDHVDELLAASGTSSGAWTIRRAFSITDEYQSRKYYLNEKAEYVNAIQESTVFAAGRGIALSLSKDYTEEPNAIYGEGTDPVDLSRWRNAKYPMLSPAKPTYPGTMSTTSGHNTDADFSYDAVTVLQSRLTAMGYGATISGTFTTDTHNALANLQQDQGVTATGSITDSGDWDLVWASGGTITDLNSGYFLPLADDQRSDFYLYYPDGSVAGDNDTGPSAYDGRIRVERVIAFGDRISKSQATANARRLVNQSLNPGWIGTITLTADPIERSRFDIREGGWINIKHLTGTDVPLFVAGVQAAPESDGQPVTLTVASQAYDLLDLTARIERNRAAADNPARSFYAQRTRPQRPFRDILGWDKESGAGLIEPINLSSGWNVIRIVGAQYGTIAGVDVRTYSTAKKFAMAVFGGSVSAATLGSWVPDPLATIGSAGYGHWDEPAIQSDLTAAGFIEAWGEPGDACGYWPGSETAGTAKAAGSVTGRMIDAASWEFASLDPPFLWVGVYASASTRFRGLMKIVPTE